MSHTITIRRRTLEHTEVNVQGLGRPVRVDAFLRHARGESEPHFSVSWPTIGAQGAGVAWAMAQAIQVACGQEVPMRALEVWVREAEDTGRTWHYGGRPVSVRDLVGWALDGGKEGGEDMAANVLKLSPGQTLSGIGPDDVTVEGPAQGADMVAGAPSDLDCCPVCTGHGAGQDGSKCGPCKGSGRVFTAELARELVVNGQATTLGAFAADNSAAGFALSADEWTELVSLVPGETTIVETTVVSRP